MIRYAIIFFVLALIAAAIGFGGVAAMGMQIAVILLVVAVILAIISKVKKV